MATTEQKTAWVADVQRVTDLVAEAFRTAGYRVGRRHGEYRDARANTIASLGAGEYEDHTAGCAVEIHFLKDGIAARRWLVGVVVGEETFVPVDEEDDAQTGV